MTARHLARSFTTSCQLGSSARSLLRTSIHLSCVPPGLLCFPCGRHLSTCFWSRWSDILCTWPSHCNRLCLSWTSIGSSPVSSRMSAFRRMSHRVTPTMSRRHLIWNVFSFLMSCWVTGHVSAPYKWTDITMVRNACTLVGQLRFRFLKISASISDTLCWPSRVSLLLLSPPLLSVPTHCPGRRRTPHPPALGLAV